MPSILYRLAEALKPDYEVEREIASGGMGSVFAARDVTLDRQVAVKIIRPELSTAEAADRFVQEAKILAQVSHPNIVPVHKAGEAAGFFYYIMDFMEGETLATRLKRGPLTADEAVSLGRDLLHAVEAVHSLGVIHRDIKPANIFIAGDRALLADFGISRSSGPQTAAGQPGEGVSGTPGYMPPEQAFGWDITERTDLYAIGMVLYEAVTGRRWEAILPEKPANWSGVPRRLGPALRRALDFDPRMRWQDARSFRRALWRTRTTKYRRHTLLLTLGGITAGAVAAFLLFGGKASLPQDFVVLPFEVESGVDPQIGVDLAELAYMSLITLNPVSFNHSLSLTEEGLAPQAILRRTDAKGWVVGSVSHTDDGSWVVHTTVVDRAGNRFEAEDIIATDLGDVGCRLGLGVVKAIDSGSQDFGCNTFLGSHEEVVSLLAGERAFRQQNWEAAKEYFQQAIEHDPTFALARWRLVNTRRWLREHQSLDSLDQFYREHGSHLGEKDRLLLDAWRRPFGAERLERYNRAVGKYSHDPYAWLLFGDDLLMRGPLLGISTDSAVAVLRKAVDLDPSMGPAYFDLAWAAIRTGRAEEAETAVRQLLANAVSSAPVPAEIIELARLERFYPDSARRMRGTATEPEGAAEAMASAWLRWGSSFDAPASQVEWAVGLLLMLELHGPLDPDVRANLYAAQGLALFEIGRGTEALSAFDSVASVLDSVDARLQGAQWRVLPPALQAGTIPSSEVDRGRATLGALASDGPVATRAAWTLAVDAFARGAPYEAQEWARHVREDTTLVGRDLTTFLEALNLARLDQYERALSTTDGLMPYEAFRAADPFFRTVLYLSRARWQTELDEPDVDRAWLWYENSDLIGDPTGIPQSGEIDWAFSTFARFHRGKAALGRGDRDLGCSLLRRVLELWAGADPGYDALVSEARQLTGERCPS